MLLWDAKTGELRGSLVRSRTRSAGAGPELRRRAGSAFVPAEPTSALGGPDSARRPRSSVWCLAVK